MSDKADVTPTPEYHRLTDSELLNKIIELLEQLIKIEQAHLEVSSKLEIAILALESQKVK
jgi:hypothetical protein